MSIQANFPAIKPTLLLDFANTEALDPRITYSRASTGTYYDGKTVAKAEENLLVYSQEFDNAAWIKFNCAVTANTAIAPDGTTTADLLYPTSSGSSRGTYRNDTIPLLQQGQTTFSFFAKTSGVSWVSVANASSGAGAAWFNLSTGVVGTVASGFTATITSVGSDWYRCTVTRTTSWPTSALLSFVLSNADNSDAVTASGTNGVLLWGAQLEQRSFATAYTPTTTAPITNYIPVMLTAASGVPRFEHNPVTGESLGLEIEEQRTNLVTYSEQFDNAAWTKTNTTITANTTAAPDGTLTADKLVENTSSGLHQTRTAVGFTISGSYSTTVYAKAGERNFIYIATLDPATYRLTYFNLVTGTVATKDASHTASITPVGNGWYRCTVSYSFQAGVAYIYYGAAILDNSDTYTGNGFSGIYIWGAQLEAGAFATSYIPTVASQVTRAADSAVMTGANFSSWYNPSEGSFYSAFEFQGPTSSRSVFVANDGTASNYITSNTSGMFNFAVTTGGALQAGFTLSVTAGATQKIAGAYRVNDFAASRNGGAVSTDTVGKVPITNSLAIGSYNTFDFLSGTISRIAYYPVRLTNAQLQALTS